MTTIYIYIYQQKVSSTMTLFQVKLFFLVSSGFENDGRQSHSLTELKSLPQTQLHGQPCDGPTTRHNGGLSNGMPICQSDAVALGGPWRGI